MKLNSKYILREIAGETILVSLADISTTKRLLCLNELGRDIYTRLLRGMSEEEIFAELLNEYEVEPHILRADLEDFLSTLRSYGVILSG